MEIEQATYFRGPLSECGSPNEKERKTVWSKIITTIIILLVSLFS